MANPDAAYGFKFVRKLGGGAGQPLETGTTRSNATIAKGAPIYRSNGLISQATSTTKKILGVAAEKITGVAGTRDSILYYPALHDMIFKGQCSGNATIGYIGRKLAIEGTGSTCEIDEDGTNFVLQAVGLAPGSAYGTNAEFLFTWTESQFLGQAGTSRRKTLFGKGAASSNVTVTGLATTDRLISVNKAQIGTGGTIISVSDVSGTAAITSANTMNVAGAAHTAKNLFIVEFEDESV